MRKLDVVQMENVYAGSGVLCGVGIGLIIGTGFTGMGAVVGAGLSLLFCLTSDNHLA